MLDSGTDDDLSGTVDANFSLIEAFDVAAVTLTGANNITGTDPMLGPLADNGGGTMTHEVPQGSAAIDAGNPATSGTFDQRLAGFDNRETHRLVDDIERRFSLTHEREIRIFERTGLRKICRLR